MEMATVMEMVMVIRMATAMVTETAMVTPMETATVLWMVMETATVPRMGMGMGMETVTVLWVAMAMESVQTVWYQLLDSSTMQLTLLGNPGNSYPGVVFPGSDAIFYNNNFPTRNQQIVKQKVRQTVRTTKRRSATTRRTPVTTRRAAPASATVRVNKVKNVTRIPVQAQKKPQIKN